MLWKVSRELLFWPISLWIFLSDCILINHTYFCPHMVSLSICEYSVNKSEKLQETSSVLERWVCNVICTKFWDSQKKLDMTAWQKPSAQNKTRGKLKTSVVLANTHLHKINSNMSFPSTGSLRRSSIGGDTCLLNGLTHLNIKGNMASGASLWRCCCEVTGVS